ncbi:MAG: PKD domain-containing protein [Myxococcota bacterium]
MPTATSEGEEVVFIGVASDPGTGLPTYAWDFGDGATSSALDASHVYADNGAYVVTLTLSSEGGVSTDTMSVAVENVAPELSVGPDLTVAEGEEPPFMASVVDPGTADTHVYDWEFGDGAVGVGETPAHAYGDDGVYLVSVYVADDDGGSDAGELEVMVENVPPVVESEPPTDAVEGEGYGYEVAFYDAGWEDTHTCVLAEAPSGMTITEDCFVSWTPSYTEALGATTEVTVVVTDDDGGEVSQSWTITIAFVDEDNDGLADEWEVANFGNTTSNDADDDPDADGVANLEEFLGNTNPVGYDGPSAPILLAPADGAEVAVATLVVVNATDPQEDALSYAFELYGDEALLALVATVTEWPEGGGGTTTWTPSVVLSEDVRYCWRVRAADAHVSGPWSVVRCFLLNTLNNAPSAPGISSPAVGGQAMSLMPALSVTNAMDPDDETLTYTFEVYGDVELTDVVTMATEVEQGEGTTAWTVGVALVEDVFYWWRVRAKDPQERSGPWSSTGLFFVSSVNSLPGTPTMVYPQNGAVVETLEVVFTIVVAQDPDLDPLGYEFEVDTAETFDGAALQTGLVAATVGGETRAWRVPAGLEEDTAYAWRVRANDGMATSDWVTARFVVSTENNPPTVPVLQNPSDAGEATELHPTLSWVASVDPEADVVSYDVEVTDASGAVVGTANGVEGTTTVVGADLTDGTTYRWHARAVDDRGAASAWSEPNAFKVNVPSGLEGVGLAGSGGCDCGVGRGARGAVGGASPLAFGLLALMLLASRRRAP